MLSPPFLIEGPEGPGQGCLPCLFRAAVHSWTRAATWPACHARLSCWAAPFLAQGAGAA